MDIRSRSLSRVIMKARRAMGSQTSSIVNGALAENINGVRTVQEMTRQGVNFEIFEGKVRNNLNSHLRATRLAVSPYQAPGSTKSLRFPSNAGNVTGG